MTETFPTLSMKTDGTFLGSSMDYSLPANLYGQEYQWTEVTLGIGKDVLRAQEHQMAGLGIAIQCASVKARDVAKAEMQLWKLTDENQYQVVPSKGRGAHWFATMLARRPNPAHSWTEFWRMVIVHLELAQNAYIIKLEDRQGRILGLVPWMPSRCRARVSQGGELFYEFHAGTEYERSLFDREWFVLRAAQVIHLRGRMWDGINGLSNAVLGNPIFGLVGAIMRFQTNLFGSDGKQPLVFEMDGAFANAEAGETAFRRLKEQLREGYRKSQATGEALLLEAGLKAKSIASNAKDSSTVDAYNQQVLRICGLMEVPPHKIYHYEAVKYDNQASADNQYANDCLVPLAKNIEEKFRLELFTEDEMDDLWPEFDRMPMLAGDPKTLMDVIDKAVKDGVMEINEARERLPLSLNPIKGGDVRYVPVNMAIVDRDGNVLHQAATGQNGNDGETERQPEQERSLRVVK